MERILTIFFSDILISKTTLYYSKSEDNVFLQWEGENPNYIVTYSTTPTFQSGNITFNDSNLGITEITFYSKYSDKDCAGDNFYITAHFTQDRPEVSRSGIITLWKRVYVERDKMFVKESSIKYAITGSQNFALVWNVSQFGVGDKIQIFDIDDQEESFGQILDIDHINGNTVYFISGETLNQEYTAGHSNYDIDKFGYVGLYYDASNPDYYPFYETDLSFIRQAYDPEYVEFLFPSKGLLFIYIRLGIILKKLIVGGFYANICMERNRS